MDLALVEHPKPNLYLVFQPAEFTHKKHNGKMYLTEHGLVVDIDDRQFSVRLTDVADAAIKYIDSTK